MAFCEKCGTPIADGQTICANCATVQQAPVQQTPTVDVAASITNSLGAIKSSGLNFIGLVAQLFNILALCLPILKNTHIWEIADMAGEYYIIAFAVIIAILASVFGYLTKSDKIAKTAGIVNLVALLIIWFPFTSFTVGFYLWLIGVVFQLVAPIGMKFLDQYIK